VILQNPKFGVVAAEDPSTPQHLLLLNELMNLFWQKTRSP